MAEQLFLQILNMSFTAGIVIIMILLIRLPLKKAPRIFSYALWSVALFRLLCPVSFESLFSLLPTNANPISRDIVYEAVPQIDTGIAVINQAVNSSLPPATPYASVNPLQIWVFVGSLIWIAGMAAMLVYSLVSLFLLKRRLKGTQQEEKDVFCSGRIATPFVLGLIRPKIYLPAGLMPEERQYILLHEQTHIHRLDHLIKLAGFLALCVHWFNPLVWAAFFLSGRDMEMSCDEAVIQKLGSNVKKDYFSSLLTLATGRRILGGTPLAFGEGDTRSRIRNILHYRKPAFWLAVVLAVAVAAVCVGLTANPSRTSGSPEGKLAMDALVSSIHAENDTITFTVPLGYSPAGDWNILVAGRSESDGLGRIVHLFEEENNAKAWHAGENYIIETDGKNYTELTMDASLPDGTKRSVDLLSYLSDAVPPSDEEHLSVSFSGEQPFTASMILPAGWQAKPLTGEENPMAGTFLSQTGLYQGDALMAMIGFQTFTPYEDEIPQEDYYKTVYPDLRLGSMSQWDPYTAVKTAETAETGIVTVSYHDPDQTDDASALASVPVIEVPGILSYDKALNVYVGIQFAENAVTEEQVKAIAESLTLSAAPSESSVQS